MKVLEIAVNTSGLIDQRYKSRDEMYDKLMLFKEAGFNYLDCLCINKGDVYARCDWIQNFRMSLIRAEMSVAQTTFPIFGNIYNDIPPVRLSLNPMEISQIDLAFRTNVEWGCSKTIIRPLTPHSYYWDFEIKHYMNFNIEYFKWILEHGARYGVDIFIETMPPLLNKVKCFGSDVNQLIKLQKMINHEQVGFGIDTEALHRSKKDIPKVIRTFGKQLGALRLSDYNDDMGLIKNPRSENIEWEPILEALKEVKYKGALSFKINGEKFDKLKKSTQIERLKNLYDIGEEFKKKIKGI